MTYYYLYSYNYFWFLANYYYLDSSLIKCNPVDVLKRNGYLIYERTAILPGLMGPSLGVDGNISSNQSWKASALSDWRLTSPAQSLRPVLQRLHSTLPDPSHSPHTRLTDLVTSQASPPITAVTVPHISLIWKCCGTVINSTLFDIDLYLKSWSYF